MRRQTMNIGSCCACGKDDHTVRNIQFLEFEAPQGFAGWGCMVCGLPSRGAVAVLCDGCASRHAEPKFMCGGKYLGDRVRVEIARGKPFEHDALKHAADDAAHHSKTGGWIS